MKPLRESDPAGAGPYRLLAEIGRGGMGRVLLGAAPDGRLVAVKLVHARYAEDDGFRVRFRREVAASRKVSGAYTAAVLEADADAPAPWLASVFVAGPSLGAAVASGGALPEAAVRRLAAGLATALAEIHGAGLVHRDLKPDNVLLAEDGVRVIDFGIARVAEPGEITELTRAGAVIGSPAYMSPEQAQGGELTPASDVFSLGSGLFLAATGRSPFAAGTVAVTLYNIVHTEPDLGGLPPGLRRLVSRCLAKDPAARPTPAELLGLAGAADGTGWPPAVGRMAAAQQEEIDRLLQERGEGEGGDGDGDADRDGDRAGLSADAGEGVGVVEGVGAGVGPDPDAATTTAPRAVRPERAHAPRGRRLPVRRLLVAAGILVAGWFGTPYAQRVLDEQPPAPPVEPDRYLSVPRCEEAAGTLPLPERNTEKDSHDDSAERSNTHCAWQVAWDVVGGAPEPKPYASVSWYVERSDRVPGSGPRRQRANFGVGRTDHDLGFGDAAYWDTPEQGQSCLLGVLDGNLMVWVGLGGPEHPAETCETEAKEIARAALAAVPR
ncbi:serine/threonine-protein kinase [Streptomyces sp. NBC_01408]|uniref:serine/threonine-protein kinase n=1 Tax=Streptomyces sp. NBC_01408 TaxID=2903855 RepID=UPI00225828C6|nr:serine/threonine-protein kinase [Streptomyces sp. NBC_01408]MCX4693585.1 serine/threonine protein kinase [Streptomyces sp. NBC_01408]